MYGSKRQNIKEDISLKINDTIIQDYQTIADKFNDYYSSISKHTVDSLSISYGSSQNKYQDLFNKTIEKVLISAPKSSVTLFSPDPHQAKTHPRILISTHWLM